MKNKRKTSTHYGHLFDNITADGIETIMIITKNPRNTDFGRSRSLDILIVKEDVWNNNEELRLCLTQCLKEGESQLILI